MWVLDHLDDLDADFRVFYRIDDINDLDGPRFFRLASRVSAYAGVMAVRVQEEVERQNGGRSGYSSSSQQSGGRYDGRGEFTRVGPENGAASAAELAMALPGVFSFGKG